MNTSDEKPREPTAWLEEVRRQAARAGRGRQMTFWQGLGLVGAIGWMVSLPAVLGALAGRWIDQQAGQGLLWTLCLLVLGLGLGCASAWRHVRRELTPGQRPGERNE